MERSGDLHIACCKAIGKTADKVDFELLYDSCQQGVSATEFHAACDELDVPTLTVLLSANSQEAVGGFATVPWRKHDNTFASDPSSLLFRLRWSPTSRSYTVERCPPVTQDAGIYSGRSHGPVFGRGMLASAKVS